MGRPLDFLDSETLALIDTACKAAIADSRASHDETSELRLAVARHVLGAVTAGEQDRALLHRSAMEYIRQRFN
jgi:hypothetical protein